MPFKSEKQRRYLWAEHPEIAKRWADKYPTKKKLPMYAKDKQDTPEKTAALHVLQSILVKTLGPATKSIFTSTCDTGTKKAETKLEHVQMPESRQPTYAGEQPVKKIPKPETEDEGSIGKERQESATVNPPSLPEMPLINKLAVVLAPAIQQQIENERAALEARDAARVPQNVNVKRYAVPSAAIQPPIGMTPPPAQPQAPAQPQTPAQAPSLPSVGGGSSPNANPINSFGGISAKGEFNGNASLGTQNAMGGEKLAGSPAWQRSEGKNDEGGLNAKGRASYNKATGGNLKAPVTESNPTGDRAKRQNSFCARMCGMKKHETGSKTKKDPDSRINKSLRKWNCKCGAVEFGQKLAQTFDPAMSRDAENAIMHGTGLVGSGALGTLAGLPVSAALEQFANNRNWIPSSEQSPFGHNLANSLLKIPMFVGGTLGLSLYDNYILRPHMKREMERKQQEEAVRQQLMKKQAEASLQRILGTALASTGGGLLLGSYPGWKMQRASEQAGNHDFVSFVAGKAPIALAGALSAGLYNHWQDQNEAENKDSKAPQAPAHPALKYLRYAVH